MPTYKLYYFNARARGEIVRLVFQAAGVPYEDIRLSFEEWKTAKADSPTGTMPYVQIDGKQKIPGSLPLARYFAKLHGLTGKTDLDQLRADVVVDLYRDLFEAMIKFSFEKDEKLKATLKEKYVTETLPQGLKKIQEVYSHNKNGDAWFVGESLTWADLYAMAMSEMYKMANPDALKPYPKLAAHYDRVRAHPKIAAYLKTRPVTEF